MKYLSLFSGIGGFELGIQQAYESNNEYAPLSEKSEPQERQEGGVRITNLNKTQLYNRNGTAPLCVGYSEIDKYAIQVYEKHFPNHKNFGDITKIKTDELPEFDFLVGGFPCQAFSIAGKRRGFDDTRGTLFFEIARILRDKRPRYFVLENVKGLLSHDSGKTFQTILGVLTDIGYDCQWQVLNSKNFGVPQNRERVFIVGHLRGEPRPKIFPIGEVSGGDIKSRKDDNSQISRTISSRFAKGVGNTESRIVDVLVNTTGKRFQSISDVVGTIKQINNPKHSNSRVYSEQGLAPTLNTAQGGNRQPKILDDYNHRMRQDGNTGTVRSTFGNEAPGNGNKLVDGTKIRRLTPLECERLQGFPDSWTDILSDTQRYKTLGNAVTVNVVEEIIKRLF